MFLLFTLLLPYGAINLHNFLHLSRGNFILKSLEIFKLPQKSLKRHKKDCSFSMRNVRENSFFIIMKFCVLSLWASFQHFIMKKAQESSSEKFFSLTLYFDVNFKMNKREKVHQNTKGAGYILHEFPREFSFEFSLKVSRLISCPKEKINIKTNCIMLIQCIFYEIIICRTKLYSTTKWLCRVGSMEENREQRDMKNCCGVDCFDFWKHEEGFR